MNFVDILMAIVIISVVSISVVSIGRNDGIVAGFFKLFGIFCAIFISLHYYVHLAMFLQKSFLGKNAGTEILSYCSLVLLIFLIFAFTTKGWGLILNIKPFAIVDRWGNMALSLTRSYFICSLLFLALLISGSGYSTNEAKKSLSWHLFRKPAVDVYRVSYKALVANIFPDEKINEKIFKLIEVTLKNSDIK